jgi:hypothetical protein
VKRAGRILGWAAWILLSLVLMLAFYIYLLAGNA